MCGNFPKIIGEFFAKYFHVMNYADVPYSSHNCLYNDCMNKVAYHFNKKKVPSKTEGKFMYYYPCIDEDKANTYLYGAPFYAIEVTEKEWESLFELDRFEYNNWHKYYRHNEPFPKDEELLSVAERMRYSDRDNPFVIASIDKLDRNRALATLTKKERQIYKLSIDEQIRQTEIAEMLGITQGAVSTTFNRARRKMDEYDYRNAKTQEEFVWKYWEIFMRDYALPNFLDVEIEFVIRQMLGDMFPFIKWFYSIGELCRFIMRYYLFDQDKLDKDISAYCSTSTQEERQHFEDYYGDRPLLVQGVYVRLCMEVRRREQNKLQESDKAFSSIYTAVEKIAKPAKLSVKDYITQRIYPHFAHRRNDRIRAFYKQYTGKKLPI